MEEIVSLDDAKSQVRIATARVALLHLAFSKTLVKEFGEEIGKELILKAIMEYGRLISERVKRGLPDLPKYGVHETRNGRTYNCIFAEIFQNNRQLDLGSLYCYVDPAKSMAADPRSKRIHKDCAACGDEYCTFETVPTTETERSAFMKNNKDWKYVDPRLIRGPYEDALK